MNIPQKDAKDYSDVELYALGFFWTEKRDQAALNVQNIRAELTRREDPKNELGKEGNGQAEVPLEVLEPQLCTEEPKKED